MRAGLICQALYVEGLHAGSRHGQGIKAVRAYPTDKHQTALMDGVDHLVQQLSIRFVASTKRFSWKVIAPDALDVIQNEQTPLLLQTGKQQGQLLVNMVWQWRDRRIGQKCQPPLQHRGERWGILQGAPEDARKRPIFGQ